MISPSLILALLMAGGAVQMADQVGTGRSDPLPPGLEEIRIGYFGPTDPEDRQGGDGWLGAMLAIEEANASGGTRDPSFRLIGVWSEDPWGSGISQVVRMVYQEDIRALVGSMDGATTHLAEQVVVKARLVLVSPVSTDKTVNLANVPWVFSCSPGDDRLADVLGAALADRLGRRPIAILSATDHDSRQAVVELLKKLARLGIVPELHMEFEPGSEQLAALIEQVDAGDAEALVLLAGPTDTARLAILARKRMPRIELFGGPAMGRASFMERAGPAAEGVIFPSACDVGAFSGSFARTFEKRYGRRPGCEAALTYDAIRLVVAAIEKVGLNRARIGAAMRTLSPWTGAAGVVDWDALGRNLRPVEMATILHGRVEELVVRSGSQR
jgi:ABC-type branched-subunit amino acid transport system substrate-binding protein